MKTAIILAGGTGTRLKGVTKTPKPLIEISKSISMLEYQIIWLSDFCDEIIVACNEDVYKKVNSTFAKLCPQVKYSIEKEKLGTGGALKKALLFNRDNYVYVCNCDDILITDSYDPHDLIDDAYKGASILLSKPMLRFGKVTLNKLGEVLKFKEKPELKIWVSAGHYAFKPKKVLRYLPDKGDLELQALQYLADKKMLRGLKYTNGLWIPINNYKDVIRIRGLLK